MRLLEVVPRFSAVAQVRKCLETTAKRILADEAADTPTTGLLVRQRSVSGEVTHELLDVAEAIDSFGATPLWISEDRDWGRNELASWYPSYWYDPVQRKSWIRWRYGGKKPQGGEP